MSLTVSAGRTFIIYIPTASALHRPGAHSDTRNRGRRLRVLDFIVCVYIVRAVVLGNRETAVKFSTEKHNIFKEFTCKKNVDNFKPGRFFFHSLS